MQSKMKALHLFLMSYLVGVLGIYAFVAFVLSRTVDQQGGIKPILAVVFYCIYLILPVLVDSIPIIFGVCGIVVFWKKFLHNASLFPKILVSIAGGSLYFMIGVAVLYSAYKLFYVKLQ